MDIYNDGGLPHGSFTAVLSNGHFYDFERWMPNKGAVTIDQKNPDGSPKKSVDVRAFQTAQATIQVESSIDGVPQNMPAQGVTLSIDNGYGVEIWRLKSIDGPGQNQGDYWKFETTWQKNENAN